MLDTAIILIAALLAGAINSIAGGGTLISFPALVWLGRDPILANATNAVAMWPGSLAAAYGFRRELAQLHQLQRQARNQGKKSAEKQNDLWSHKRIMTILVKKKM